MTTDFFGAGSFLHLDDSAGMRRLAPYEGQTPSSYANSLASFMAASLNAAGEDLCDTRDVELCAQLSRLAQLIGKAVGSSGAKSPKGLIEGGGTTAVTATWWCLGALPQLFREIGVDRPTTEELRVATQEIFKFLQNLATHHFSGFAGLVSLCREVTPGGQKLNDSFNPDTLVLAARPQGTDVSNFGLLEFGVSGRVSQRVIAHLQSKADGKQLPTTGCPALFAMGQESTVIPELFAWVLEVAEKFYFPHVIRHSEQEQRMT